MGIQSFAYTLNLSNPLVDIRTGLALRDGRDFLLALWNRTGGGTGIVPKVSDPLVATGATIADALQLVNDWNLVATVPAGSGVQILPLKPGNDIEVLNTGANSLKVYPPSPQIQIDALGNGAPYVLPAGKLRIFQCWTLSQFVSLGN